MFKLVKAGKWRWPSEHINVKEARVTVMAVRHACRLRRNFGRRMVVLSDFNVGLLALTKGRSSSRQLNGHCRHLAAYSLACEMQVRVRFVPTEVNVADEASRRWSGPDKYKAPAPDTPKPVVLRLESLLLPPAPDLVTHTESLALSCRKQRCQKQRAQFPALVPDSDVEEEPVRTAHADRRGGDHTTITYNLPCPKLSPMDSLRHSFRGSACLEVFSGRGGLTAAIRSQRLSTLPTMDITKGPVFDLSKAHVQTLVLCAIKAGWVAYVHVATPRTVWPRARHNLQHRQRAKRKEMAGLVLLSSQWISSRRPTPPAFPGRLKIWPLHVCGNSSRYTPSCSRSCSTPSRSITAGTVAITREERKLRHLCHSLKVSLCRAGAAVLTRGFGDPSGMKVMEDPWIEQPPQENIRLSYGSSGPKSLKALSVVTWFFVMIACTMLSPGTSMPPTWGQLRPPTRSSRL